MQTDKPLKIMNAWKKEAQGTFWLRTQEGKPVVLSELVVGAAPSAPATNGVNGVNGANGVHENGHSVSALAKPIDTSKRMSPSHPPPPCSFLFSFSLPPLSLISFSHNMADAIYLFGVLLLVPFGLQVFLPFPPPPISLKSFLFCPLLY